MGEVHSKGTSLDLDEIKGLLSEMKDSVLETQKIANKGINVKSNSKEVHTTNQEVEALLKSLNNIRKTNTLQKYFTDAETAQNNLLKAYEKYQEKLKTGSEKQRKQATADVARYANAFSALGGNPDAVDKKIGKITSQYMKNNNPSTGWLYGVDNFKEAFDIMRQIEKLAPGTFFKEVSNEAEKAGNAVAETAKKVKTAFQGGIGKSIFDSDEGEREANKLVETLDKIWAKVSVGNKELSSGEAIDFVSAFQKLNYYLDQTPRKMDDARASLVDFKTFLDDIYDFVPEKGRSELTDFMMAPNGQIDQKAMLGIAIEYWQDLAKSINQAADAKKNFYSNQFIEIPQLTDAQKQYRRLVNLVQEYYELVQKGNKGNRTIVPYENDNLSMLVYGGDTRRKNGNLHTTQASLKRLLSDYDSMSSDGKTSEKTKNHLVDTIAAYTYALDKAVDAEKLFGKSHSELFAEVAARIKSAEEAADAYSMSMRLMGDVASGVQSMGGNLVTFGDFDKFKEVLLSGGVEESLKYLVETLGMKLPEAVKETTDAIEKETSAEKESGNIAEEASKKDTVATESKKKKTEAKKESAKASEDEAKAEEEAAKKAAEASKQREWNAKKLAQQSEDALSRVFKSETHNANGTITTTDYVDRFRTRTTKSGYDKNGDYYILESTKENYVELEKQIQRNDKEIVKLTKDMYLNAKAGADTSAWDNQISALKEYNKALLDIRNNKWVGMDDLAPEEYHAAVFDAERLKAQEKDWESVVTSAQKRLKEFASSTDKLAAKPLMPELAADVKTLNKELVELSTSSKQIDFKNSNIEIVQQQVVEFLQQLTVLESKLNDFQSKSVQDEFIPAKVKEIQALDNNIMSFYDNNTAAGKESKEVLEAIHEELRQIIDTGEQISKVRLDMLAGRAHEVEAEVRRLHQTGNSFFRSFTKQLKSANAQFLATYFSFQDIIRYVREVASTVTEIDSALTELRKVSDASTERLNQSLETSAETAKELGASITHVINVTADWARLGYNVDAAEDLARATALFQNVGDNMSADDASSFMISTLQGFQLATEEAEHIVDVYNEVANNFAIDTAGIGEAIKRSAASFNAANTELEGAVAVITAANSVVQNPEMVGTAMKTLSARIRGSKVELEELGEAEEDVVNLTSKLRREVKAMTGFDIMKDEDTYKSIDEIIVGIGEHWKDLTDIQQAALAEDLAGKRNSNVLIALLQNAELVEKVYNKAKDAQGSAAREQENYMKSIEYSLKTFTASWQKLQSDFLSSRLLKEIVDFGTDVVNVLDEIVNHSNALVDVIGIIAITLGVKNHKAIIGAIADLAQFGREMKVAGRVAAEVPSLIAGAQVGVTDLVAGIGAAGPIVLGIVAAVGIAVVAFDALTVSVEESQKKIDVYNDSIKKISDELEKLRDLEEKTPKDNKRIEYLERELQIQERLLEIEQQRYYQNLTEESFANYFDKNNIGTQQRRAVEAEAGGGGVAGYIKRLNNNVRILSDLNSDIDKLNNGLDSNSDKLDKTSAKRDEYITSSDKLYTKLFEEYQKYAEQEKQLNEALEARTAAGNNMLRGSARKDAYKQLGFAKRELDKISKTLRDYEKVTGEFDPFNTTTGIGSERSIGEIERVINSTSDLETVQSRLMAQFPSLDAVCSEYGITLEELVEHYREAAEAAEEANEAIGDSPLFDQSTFSEEVNKLDALQSAYNSFVENSAKDKSKANLDIADVEGLREVFGDITGFDFDNFELVVTADTSGVDDIQKAFDDAITAYANYKISLEGITEENKDMIRTQLELEGATHESAQAFVDAKLEEANAADFATQSEEAFQAKLRESINIASLTKTQIKQEMDELQRGGSVDLSIRPVIDTSQLPAEWGEEPGNIATLLTNTFANEDATVAMNFTPIMTDENGNYIGALTPDELEEYAWEVLHGAEDSLHLQIGAEFTGADAIAQAEEAAERIHKLQAVYYEQAGEDHFAEFVEEDTYALMAEAEQLGISSEALARYKLSKIDIGNVPIDTAVDRAQLLALVQMLGVTGDEVIQLSRLIALLNGGEIMARERRENIINRINEIIAESVSKAANVEVKYDYDKAAKSAKSGGSKAGKEAGDAYVKAFEEELKALEEQRDAGLLSEKQFLEKYKALIEKYFKDVDGYGEEYAKRMADYFKRTISYLESVFSAVGTLLDKRISAAQKGKDAAVQALNDEKDAAAEAYQSQIDHIDELIEAKEEEIDLIDEEIERYQDQIKAIDDQIDALEEANQKRQQAINLQKAQYELEKAQNQRTRLIYKDGQMVYENDSKEVRQARENLEDAEFEVQKQQLEDLKKPLQEQIDLLEKQKDLIEDEIEAYKKQQEELKKALEASNAYYDDLIKQTERYWDAIIDGLEKQKSKWEELAEFKEIANAYALIQEAGEELGYSVEDILNDVPGAFEAFRDAYLNVLQEANSGNQNFLDGLTYATGAAKDNVNASLTEISTKASEVSTALEPLSDVSTKVEDTATALGNVATNGGTAASSVGTLGDKLNDVAGSSEGISDINDSVQNIASTSLGDTVQAFNDLYEALDKCAQALGIGEGEMSTFESALKAISEISLGDDTTGAIGAFTALAGAVDTVTSAIGGGGGSSDDPTESKSDSMSDGASGGLITAIEDVNQAAKDNIGTSSSVGEGGATGSSGDGGTVISDFDALYGSINNVIELIGSSKNDYSEDGATLINAVKGLPVVGKEAITGEAGVVPMFEELLEAIIRCVKEAEKLLAALREIKELRESLGSEDGMATGNVHVGQYATGNVHGNAYASGRLGLKKSENALVGEIGQELVYNPSTGTYRTVGDHGPEITRLQKGDLVFNAEQTKAIIKHGKRHGNSYANGTGLVPLSDAETNMFKTIGNALMGIKADTSQMLEPVRTLAKNVSKVTTNNVNPVININGTSFTVAGVTGEAVALQIQDVFAGLVSNAYQRAMK